MGDQVMQPFEMNSTGTMAILSATSSGNKETRHIGIAEYLNPNPHRKFSPCPIH